MADVGVQNYYGSWQHIMSISSYHFLHIFHHVSLLKKPQAYFNQKIIHISLIIIINYKYSSLRA